MRQPESAEPSPQSTRVRRLVALVTLSLTEIMEQFVEWPIPDLIEMVVVQDGRYRRPLATWMRSLALPGTCGRTIHGEQFFVGYRK